MSSKDNHTKEGGHRTPRAKAGVRKMWYKIMTEAKNEERNRHSDHSDGGVGRTETNDKAEMEKQQSEEGMEVEVDLAGKAPEANRGGRKHIRMP